MMKLTAGAKPKFMERIFTLRVQGSDLSLILLSARQKLDEELLKAAKENNQVMYESQLELLSMVVKMEAYIDDEDETVRKSPLVIQ